MAVWEQFHPCLWGQDLLTCLLFYVGSQRLLSGFTLYMFTRLCPNYHNFCKIIDFSFSCTAFVIVNFIWHLVWVSDSQKMVKHYLWVCLGGCFWKRWAFESVDRTKSSSLTSLHGHHSPMHWGFQQRRKVEKRSIRIFSLTHTFIATYNET